MMNNNDNVNDETVNINDLKEDTENNKENNSEVKEEVVEHADEVRRLNNKY